MLSCVESGLAHVDTWTTCWVAKTGRWALVDTALLRPNIRPDGDTDDDFLALLRRVSMRAVARSYIIEAIGSNETMLPATGRMTFFGCSQNGRPPAMESWAVVAGILRFFGPFWTG
jgi:hypothetical protein